MLVILPLRRDDPERDRHNLSVNATALHLG
jgi:hypothetical protein